MLAATNEILQGDCIEQMRNLPAESIDLVFADPPFNIGYDYDQYDDRQTDEAYLDWSRAWMAEVHRLLKPTGTFWLAIGDEYAADLKVIAQRELGFTTRSWVVWYYTFGVNCKRKFSRSHAHLFHFVKDAEEFTFNGDDQEVRIPSARALVYGDKRANPKGRLPDDTWILRPQDFQSDRYGFSPLDDTWYFARVAGTFKERQGFHGCQMPEQLLGRIVRISSNPGDVVLDPFAGSGTTLAVAKKLGREWLGVELSDDYVRYATQRLEGVAAGEPLDGPADAIASAPTTAEGRRLAEWREVAVPVAVTEPEAPAPATVVLEPEVLEPEVLEPEVPEPEVPEPVAIDVATEPPAVKTMLAPELPLFADEIEAPAAVPQCDEAIPTASTPAEPAELAPSRPVPAAVQLRDLQRLAIAEAFLAAGQGYSVDRLLADPALQADFHARCSEAGLLGSPGDWNHALVGLRKAGKLPKHPHPQTTIVPHAGIDLFRFAAEVAWRLVLDNHPTTTIDEIFCRPELALAFDKHAARFAPQAPAAELRWAALQLRKGQHALAAEAKAYHYVLSTRDFGAPQKLSQRAAKSLAGQAGVYLLLGARKKPLLVSESRDLGARLALHAVAPGSKTVALQFAALPETELPSSDYREPLKVDLVRRYQPAWNVL